jgi:hypothetical protein
MGRLYNVTKAQNEIFVQRVKDICDLLGISASWEIEFEFKKIDDEDINAEVYCDVQARRAVVTNSTIRNKKPTAKMMREDATHEALHILLAPLHELAEERFISSEKVINTEIHAVIQTLIKLI